MNITEAKRHVKDTIETYLATDEAGIARIDQVEQRPLFLIGAPGIGKTAIVSQAAEELGIGLVSYSMTHHTRQSALGLPFIVHKEFDGLQYDASEYTMSEIIAAIYDYMAATGARRGILFLDEINCVSETLYPSMLQFLQFKTFGRHRVPDGWIIVCAGNPPEYNKSVHDFDIVTLDRLRKIEIEPDYSSWKTYAANAGVHPAILSFLEIEKDAFYSVESTTFGKKFVTARSWVDLSRTMTLFEEAGKTVDKTLIGQFLQDDDIAERFASYYMLFDKYRDDYRIEAILAGDIADDVRERAQAAPFDERLALIGLILDKLGAAMSNVAEQEGALERVRDILREDKPTLLAGGTVPETLGTRIAAVESELANREGAPLSAATRRILAEELEMLRELRGECELTKNMEGEAAFNAIHYAYRGLVSNLEHSIKNAGAALDNAFDFVENVLADDREMLVFLTELTARKTCISYINHFGNERYFANNSRLMVSEKATDLKAKIAKLSDAQNTSATEAAPAATQATPQPTTPSPSPSAAGSPSPKELEAYYKNTDFEYGFASLCNMTLPGDIRGLSVLDIGCRRGKGVFKMSDRVGEAGRAVGIDWSADYITEATTRMDRAWHKSGLTRNNMEFYQGYPEDLVVLGFGDATFDLVFVNSVLNLCADPQAVIREAYRVLKPGGRLVCEGAVASGTRDASVVEAARKLGNSIQAGPARDEFIAAVKAVGFQEPAIIDNKPVEPDTGYKTSHKVACAPSEETVTFEATVFEFKK